MDKSLIFENQISSLKEIVKIQEKQLSNYLSSPEEILNQWRNKVHELLVKNSFLLQQNREFESNIKIITREKENECNKNSSKIRQREKEIEILKNKLEELKIEKEDSEQNHAYVLTQNKQLKEQQSLIRFRFQDILETVKKQYELQSSKSYEEILSSIQNLEKKISRIYKVSKNLHSIKEASSKKIERIEQSNIDFKEKIVQALQISNEELGEDENYFSGNIEANIIKKIQTFFNEKAILNQQFFDLQFQFQNNYSQNQKLLDEIANLNQNIIQKEIFIEDLKRQLSGFEIKLESEIQNNRNLELEFNNKNRELNKLNEEMRQYQRCIEELQNEKNMAFTQQKEATQELKSLENQKTKELAELNLSLQKIEKTKQEEIRKLKIEHDAKMLEFEDQKNDIIHSLRLDLENLTEQSEKDAKQIEIFEHSLETAQSKIASLLNQVNDLLKIIELKDKDLKKYRNQHQPLDISQGTRSYFMKGLSHSKINSNSLETPQIKTFNKRDENKSPTLSQGWGTLIKTDQQSFVVENNMLKSQSKFVNRLEAIEKMALNLLDDEDDFNKM